MKRNCWEVMNCGREVGGTKVDALGVCPASRLIEFDGINNGINRNTIEAYLSGKETCSIS
jgi:hypothetical protein